LPLKKEINEMKDWKDGKALFPPKKSSVSPSLIATEKL
jgi:hypothetical protein